MKGSVTIMQEFSLGIVSGKYMYLETNEPRKAGDVAVLLSEAFDPVSSSGRCIHFWYHMYGSGIGTLSVIVKTQGKSGCSISFFLFHEEQVSNSCDQPGWLSG